MNINLDNLSIGFYLIAIGIGVGLFIGWRRQQHIKRRESESRFAAGKAWVTENPIAAVCELAEASALWPNPEARILQGEVLESLGEYRAAAHAFDDAHSIVIGWRRSREWIDDVPLTIRTSLLTANAYMRAKIWDFARIRANAALFEVNHFADGATETESNLRLIRMLATLHLKRGSKAWEEVRPDAQWIIAHSASDEHRQLADGLLAADDVWKFVAQQFNEDGEVDDDSAE